MVTGLARVTPFTASTSAPKSLTATCPAGTRVIGPGGDTTPGDGSVVLNQIRPDASLTSVTVHADEDEVGTPSNWFLQAFVICAAPPAGLELVSATSASTSSEQERRRHVSERQAVARQRCGDHRRRRPGTARRATPQRPADLGHRECGGGRDSARRPPGASPPTRSARRRHRAATRRRGKRRGFELQSHRRGSLPDGQVGDRDGRHHQRPRAYSTRCSPTPR